MSIKIAVLCSDGPHHTYLIKQLQKHFDSLSIIVESSKDQRKRILKQKKYIDYFYSLYHNIRRNITGLNRYRQKFFQCNDPIVPNKNITIKRVSWINEPSVSEYLKGFEPDVTVVMGTSILKKSVLYAAGENVINIHGGYLPDYRGNHCIFFAYINGDFDKIGSTIHFINSKIDDGDIIENVKADFFWNDTPEALYCRAEKLAIHRLIEYLHFYENGIGLPRKRNSGGKTYHTRDRKFYHELIYIYLRILKNLQSKKKETV